MIIDKYLVFANEAEALEALAQHGLYPVILGDEGEAIIMRVHSGADDRGKWLVEIGVPVVVTPAVYDAHGEMVSPAVMADGYHVNVRLVGFDIDFGTHEAQPQTAQRVFA